MKSIAVLMLLLPLAAYAFTPVARPVGQASSTALGAVRKFPKFNKKTELWEYTSDDQKPEAGYDAVGSLLRQGPKAYLIRVTNPEKYEQAVLKFMAGDKVGRMEAQGNMDAFFENAQDWAFARFESERTGIKRDYVTVDKEKLILTTTWGTAITGMIVTASICYFNGINFWTLLGFEV